MTQKIPKTTISNILKTIQQIEKKLKTIKTQLNNNPPQKPINPYATNLTTNEPTPTPDFQNENWPTAIDPALIISTENNTENNLEKQYRALQIINLIQIPTASKNILDCGCGQGHNSYELSNISKNTTAYDIKQHNQWHNLQKTNLTFTTDKTTVNKNAPYDFILLYDVLDHLEKEKPEQYIEWIKTLLTPNGQIFIRCHPWTSITGGHLYEQSNKAYLHLILTPEELKQHNLTLEPNLKIIRPMAAYELWFKKANLTLENKQIETTPIDNFFTDNHIKRIINITWNGKINIDSAKKIITNTWIDYTLKNNTTEKT